MMGARLKYPIGAWAVRLLGGSVFLFLILPILAIIPLSFTSGVELAYPLPSFSLRWYKDFFDRPEWLFSLKNSLLVGGAATLLATALGTLAAFGLRHLPARLRAVLAGLMILPMAVPVIITAVALFFFYAKVGLTSSFTGLMLAYTTMGLPFVLISVRAALFGLNPDLARAAASLGAKPYRVLLRVTVPLVMPGIVTGALFAFAVSFDDVVVAMFLSGPGQITLPRQMFAGVRENISPTILAASTLMVLLSILLMMSAQFLSGRRRS